MTQAFENREKRSLRTQIGISLSSGCQNQGIETFLLLFAVLIEFKLKLVFFEAEPFNFACQAQINPGFFQAFFENFDDRMRGLGEWIKPAVISIESWDSQFFEKIFELSHTEVIKKFCHPIRIITVIKIGIKTLVAQIGTSAAGYQQFFAYARIMLKEHNLHATF